MQDLQEQLKKLESKVKLLKSGLFVCEKEVNGIKESHDLCELLPVTIKKVLTLIQQHDIENALLNIRGTVEHIVSFLAEKYERPISNKEKKSSFSSIQRKIKFLYENTQIFDNEEQALQPLQCYEVSSTLGHNTLSTDLTIEIKKAKVNKKREDLDLLEHLQKGIGTLDWFLNNYLETKFSGIDGENAFYEKLKNPYLGLNSFTEKDKDFFFGRDGDIKELIELLGNYRLILLLGNSGQGKTSLLQAGLIPKLKEQGNWHIVYFRPEKSPVENLNNAQKNLSNNKTSKTPLLVVDQFEDLFVNTKNKQIHETFIIDLLKLLDNNIKLLFSIRNDFSGEINHYPIYNEKINSEISRTYHLSNIKNLKEVIVNPAVGKNKEYKVTFETGLEDKIIKDLNNIHLQNKIVNQPVVSLPLLQFTLEKLWEEQLPSKGMQLTYVCYEKIGGVKNALIKYADDIYKEIATSQEKEQQLISTLVLLVEKTENGYVRKVVPKDQLQYNSVVNYLSDSRLITISKENNRVELVHDALLQYWDTLHQHLEKYEKFLNWRNELDQHLKIWKNTYQNEDLRISSWLDQTLEMRKNYCELLTSEQIDYIQKCVEWRAAKNREKELLLEQQCEIHRIQEEKSNAEKLLLKQEVESERQLNKEQIRKKQLSFIAVIIIAIFATYSWFQKEVANKKTNETSRQESLRLTDLSKQSFDRFQKDIKVDKPSEGLVQSMLLALESLPENNNRPLVSEAEQNLEHLINAYWEQLLSTLPVSYRNLPAFFDTNFNLSDKKEPILFYNKSDSMYEKKDNNLGGLFLWQNNGQKKFIPTLYQNKFATLSPDYRKLLIQRTSNVIEIWDIGTEEKLSTFDFSKFDIKPFLPVFSFDNEHILIGETNYSNHNRANAAGIWNIYQSDPIYAEYGINQAHYVDNGKKLEVISQSQLKIVDVKTGKTIKTQPFENSSEHYNTIVKTSPNFQYDLKIRDFSPSNKTKFELWDNNSQQLIYESEYFQGTHLSWKYQFVNFIKNSKALAIYKGLLHKPLTYNPFYNPSSINKFVIEIFDIEQLKTIMTLGGDGFGYSLEDISKDKNQLLICKTAEITGQFEYLNKLDKEQNPTTQAMLLNILTGEKTIYEKRFLCPSFFDKDEKFIVRVTPNYSERHINVHDKTNDSLIFSYKVEQVAARPLLKEDIFYKEPEIKQIAQDLFEAVFKNKTWKVTQDNKSLLEKVLIFDQEKNELSGADSLKVPYPHFESLQDKMAFLKSLLPRQTLTCEERRQFKLSLGQNCLKEIDE
jgi:hypothetical protein